MPDRSPRAAQEEEQPLGAFDIDDGDEDEWEDFDCGMDRHGNCGKAGSEQCDFECPFRNLTR